MEKISTRWGKDNIDMFIWFDIKNAILSMFIDYFLEIL